MDRQHVLMGESGATGLQSHNARCGRLSDVNMRLPCALLQTITAMWPCKDQRIGLGIIDITTRTYIH